MAVDIPKRWLYRDQIHPCTLEKQESYILQARPEAHRVLLVGDLHGAFHTLFRLVARWSVYGFLDIETLRVPSDCLIVFLGDFVDRGQYSLEVLTLISVLFFVNMDTGRVMILRGNHEEPRWSVNRAEDDMGLFKQLSRKCTVQDMGPKLYEWLSLMPVAAELIWGDYRVWCSHGLFPSDTFNGNVLTKDQAHQVMWNDVSESTLPGGYKVHGTRGHVLDSTRIAHIMAERKLDFVFRGHQDYEFNAWIPFRNHKMSTEELFYSHSQEPFVAPVSSKNTPNSKAESRRDQDTVIRPGPASAFFAHKMFYATSESAPVMTLATCTDVGKYLPADSFALLTIPR
jgi:hypothetical protein